MIDARKARDNIDALHQAIAERKVDAAKADVDRWLELDGQRRKLQQEIDGLNSQKRELAQLGRTDPDAARQKGQELRQQGRQLEQEMGQVVQEWQAILDWFPNWSHPDMPRGAGEEDNVEEKAWIPGQGYLDAGQLGKGFHCAAAMPQRLLHADEADFEPQHHGRRIYWYVDRKHFLLGRYITDDWLADMKAPTG